MFFDPQKYDLSKVGRHKLNAKLSLTTGLDVRTLECADFIQTVHYLLRLKKYDTTRQEMGEIGSMKLPRSVVVTTNPLAFLATVEDRELYAPYDTLETLIRRLAPFEAMGRKLCAEDAQQKKI